MNTGQLVEFVRHRGLAVVATRSQEGAPQAALVGIAATDRGELIFDTAVHSRKYSNLRAFTRVAVVIGWDDEVTLQCEGDAEILAGAERDRCQARTCNSTPTAANAPRTRTSCSCESASTGAASTTTAQPPSEPTASN